MYSKTNCPDFSNFILLESYVQQISKPRCTCHRRRQPVTSNQHYSNEGSHRVEQS